MKSVNENTDLSIKHRNQCRKNVLHENCIFNEM